MPRAETFLTTAGNRISGSPKTVIHSFCSIWKRGSRR